MSPRRGLGVDTRPNPYKIQPRTIVIEAGEEIPVNYRENLLFFFLGALCAAVFGLSLYESAIQERFMPSRAPASVTVTRNVEPESQDYSPYQNLPSLY